MKTVAVFQDALKIPALEQRLIYAGTQLEELVTPLWRQRRSTGALAAALGLDKLPDGAPLTLEHYGVSESEFRSNGLWVCLSLYDICFCFANA